MSGLSRTVSEIVVNEREKSIVVLHSIDCNILFLVKAATET